MAALISSVVSVMTASHSCIFFENVFVKVVIDYPMPRCYPGIMLVAAVWGNGMHVKYPHGFQIRDRAYPEGPPEPNIISILGSHGAMVVQKQQASASSNFNSTLREFLNRRL